VLIAYFLQLQSLESCISMILFYSFILILLRLKYQDFHDYFFSGILDGTMILKLASLFVVISFLL